METALIQLTTAGADTGNFSLLSNVTGYGTAFESGISRASLLAGYTSNLVPTGTTTIRVKSNSASCSNYVDIAVGGITTTSTTTTTTSPTPNAYLQNNSNFNITIKFTIWVKNIGGSYAPVYSSPTAVSLLVGDTYNFYQSVYPGIYPTNNKGFRITIDAGSIGINNSLALDASIFYMETLGAGNTSFAYFDNNSPASTTATDSITSNPSQQVPYIHAQITGTI